MTASTQKKQDTIVDQWWKPENFAARKPFLEKRMMLNRAVRDYFDRQDFWEVETPILQKCPVMDAHIHGFSTEVKGVDLQVKYSRYLHTSPEFAMKKLLVAGLPRIYQLCHVFRNGEESGRHSPEFTMLEWYRAAAGYEEIQEDCVGLLRHCAQALNITQYHYQNHACDPFAEWHVISVVDAFKQYADMDLTDYWDDTAGFNKAVQSLGLHTAPDDGWDDLFFRVMGEKIEPYLGMGQPTILKDYPVALASLARPKSNDPRLAERFELYVCGIELANAFGELTDANAQRERFKTELDLKEKLYGERYPIDDDFIAALEHGMPQSGGIALGMDRLVMLACGVDDIEQILWTGKIK